jgi:hypothetical protein
MDLGNGYECAKSRFFYTDRFYYSISIGREPVLKDTFGLIQSLDRCVIIVVYRMEIVC